MRTITHIVVHHSASPLSTTAEDITRWHKAKKWAGAGYHLICEATGEMKLGRPIGKVGAHCRGSNKSTIGICLVGDNTKPGMVWTPEQWSSLRAWLEMLDVLFPGAETLGHRDMPGAATECPGLDIREMLEFGIRI